MFMFSALHLGAPLRVLSGSQQAVRCLASAASARNADGAGSAVAVRRADARDTFIPTLKFSPTDITAPSHELMLRAGLMRQTGPGLFSLLPLGLRSLNKLKALIHTEMAAIGGKTDICSLLLLLPPQSRQPPNHVSPEIHPGLTQATSLRSLY